MRRGFAIVAIVVTILAVVGIGVAAYNAGERNGIAQGIEQVQIAQENGQDVQVVHVVDDGQHGSSSRGSSCSRCSSSGCSS